MTTTIDIDSYRRFFAEELRAVCRLESAALVDAFARVPRERFLGPGPWQVPTVDMLDPRGGGYYTTPDADARRVHHNIAIAIDAKRQLNNGHPGTLAIWIEWLGLAPGSQVVHVGAGTGYYTAVMADVVGPKGRVHAFEVDAALAAEAKKNLAPWSQVTVESGDGTRLPWPADAIFVNAGVTHPLDEWLDGLADGGRMLLPVTASFGPLGKGTVVRIERHGDTYTAKAGGLVMIYGCAIARDEEMSGRLGRVLASGGTSKIRSLRRDDHAEEESCLIHRPGACLSSR